MAADYFVLISRDEPFKRMTNLCGRERIQIADKIEWFGIVTMENEMVACASRGIDGSRGSTEKRRGT